LATFKLTQFSHPEILKQVAPKRLLKLLSPHAKFLASRGLPLPTKTGPIVLDCEILATILMSPDAVDMLPKPLIEALYFIDEMATPQGMDSLLQEAKRQDLKLDDGEDHSPADVAVQVWLIDRDVLERKHAERHLTRPRSFEYYQADGDEVPAFAVPTDAALRALEQDLDDGFEKKKRGRGARVFAFPSDNEIWFLIRHGDPYKREGSIESGKPSSVFYRPEKFDVVVYQRAVGEIRIHAGSPWEREMYRRQFGKHLFGDDNFFPGDRKYTLAPLRESGADCLKCFDVEGIEWVKLIEVQYFWGGEHGEIEICKTTDIFAALEAHGRTIPEKPRIILAKLQVKFSDSKTPRAVKIRPGNIAEYTRDGDSVLVEEWLTRRGFIAKEVPSPDESADEVLVGN
jgi:hypothetical protein